MKLVLEPRCLFDASIAVAADHAADTATQSQSVAADDPGSHADASSHDDVPAPATGETAVPVVAEAREIMFVDQRVAGWEQLVANARPDVQVVVLDLHRDAISQISEALADRQGIEAIHIVSHGSAGEIDAGSEALTSAALAANADQVAAWADHLAVGADILIWGCDVGAGATGQALLADLHTLTGADVAASTDATGASASGGDWVLENATGDVEHDAPITAAAVDGYDTLLAAPTIDDTYAANQTREVLEDGTLSMSDLAVSGTGTLTVTITLTEDSHAPVSGTFSLNGTTGLTFSTGDGTNDTTMTFSGTQSAINAALNGLTYHTTANYNGDANFAMTVIDGSSLSANKDVAVQVVQTNDAPDLNPLGAGDAGIAAVNEGLGNVVTLTPAHFGIDATSLATLGLFDADLDPALSTVTTQTTDQLTFEILSVPVEGRLLKDGAPLLPGSLFTLADLIAGKIKYEHQGAQANEALVAGSESDSFNVKIRDGAGGEDTGTINIRINPVNQAPTASGTATVTAYEGRNGVPVAITVSDPDQVSGTWKITFSELALTAGTTLYLDNDGNGQFGAGDTQITDGYVYTGTLAALNAALRVDISGDEPTTPLTFKVTVTDDDGGTINAGTTAGDGASSPSVITINPVENNDHPELATNTGYTGAVGEWYRVLTSAELGITDVDSPDETLTYTVTSAIVNTNGTGGTAQLQMAGEALVVGSTFTQADIDAGRVRIVLTGGTVDSANNFSFGFSVRDGEITAFSTVRQVEDRIEGGTRNAGDTAYLAHQFNFSFTPTSGPGPGIPDAPANVAPVVTVVGISAGELTESGAEVTIGSNGDSGPRIEVTDPDNDPSEITIRLETLPVGGTLLLDGQPVPLFGSFTQQDLIDGKVTYRHDGGEQFLSSNLGFSFSVSDGSIAFTPVVDASSNPLDDGFGHNFSVEATPVNDTPAASVDKTATVAEGGTVTFNTAGQPTITLTDVDGSGDAGPGALDTYESNAGSDGLYVTITALPTYGKIYSNGVELHVGDTLLKTVIESGQFTYTHDGTENFTDSFQLTVNDDQTIAGQPGQGDSMGNTITVDIQVAPVNDDPSIDPSTPAVPVTAGTTNTGLRVVEGGTGVIGGSNASYGGIAFNATTDGSTRAQLVSTDPDNTASQIQYRILTNVTEGKLMLNGQVLGVGSTFTQADLDAGRVTYVHLGDNGNGQGVVSDSFTFQVGDAGPGTYPTGQFDIEVWNRINDAPTVSVPSTPVAIDDTAAGSNPITGVSVGDPDFADNSGVLQVTVRLTAADGTPLANDGAYTGYTITSSTPGTVTIDAAHDGDGTYLVLRGTTAEINTYLAGLQFGSTNDPNTVLKLEIVADDRVRDGSGVLDASGLDANGGEQNQNLTEGGNPVAVGSAEFNAYSTLVSAYGGYNVVSKTVTLRVSPNDEPATVTVPGPQTVNEDIRTTITGISVSDPESTGFGINTTVTLSVGSGKLNVGSSADVSVSGNGSGTVTLTGPADKIDALLALGVDYTSATDSNVDTNGAAAGDVTLTVTIAEGSAAIGNEAGGYPGDDLVSQTIAIDITPVNDAPVVGQSGGAIAVSDPLVPVAVGGFSVADKDISGDAGNLAAGEQDFLQVTVRLLDENGDPLASGAYADVVLSITQTGGLVIDSTLDGTDSALQIRGTRAEINAALAGLQVTLGTGLGNTDQPYRVQVVADDRIRDLASGALDASGIDANGGELNNSSGSTAAQAVPTTVFDPYSSAATGIYNLSAATRVIWPSSGNEPPNADKPTNATVDEDVRTRIGGDFIIADTESDNFGLDVRVTLTTNGNGILSVGGTGAQNGSTISGVTIVSGDETGTLVLEGKASAIEALLNHSTNGLHYTSDLHDNGDHNGGITGDVTVTVTLDEHLAATTFGVTPQTDTTTFAITVNPVNDAPVLAGTSLNPTAQVAASGTGTGTVALVSGASATDVDFGDAGVSTFGGGTLTISFTDGYQAGDRLTVDGMPAGVALISGGSGNALVITLTASATAADVKAIIEAVRYQSVDADPTAGGTDATRAFRIVLNDGNNDDGAGHDAGGPAALNSNALTGTIAFAYSTPTATDNTAAVVLSQHESDGGNLLTDNDGSGIDSDPEADPLTVTDVAGTTVPGAGTVTVTGTYGTLTIAADGSYTYQLDPTNPAVAALTGTDTLSETFTYTISDGQRTDSADLVVTIKAPVAVTPVAPPVVVTPPVAPPPPAPPPVAPLPPMPPAVPPYTPPPPVVPGSEPPPPSLGDGYTFSQRPMEYARTWGGDRPYETDLMLVGSVGNRFIIPNQPSNIEVPPNIFRHTNPNEPLTYEARRPDGSPLPKWLVFDARNLTFKGVPPDSAKGAVDVVITAKDTKGHKAEAQFRILVGQKVGDDAPVHDGTRPPAQDARPPQLAPDQRTEVQGGDGWSAPLTEGRSAFSLQLREAGRLGVLAKARALLDMLGHPAA